MWGLVQLCFLNEKVFWVSTEFSQLSNKSPSWSEQHALFNKAQGDEGLTDRWFARRQLSETEDGGIRRTCLDEIMKLSAYRLDRAGATHTPNWRTA